MLLVVVTGCLIALATVVSVQTARERTRRQAQHGDSILQADVETFSAAVLKSDTPVVVDFYSEWCPPCDLQAAILHDLAAEAEGFKIVQVNVDAHPELAKRYGVQAYPTLLIFKRGEVAVQRSGVATESQIRQLLDAE